MDYRSRLIRFMASAAVCAVLAACQHTTQTTSGSDYLRAYQQSTKTSKAAAPMDDEVRAAAAVEPLLRFPARIGLARIGKGRNGYGIALTGIPEHEAAAWQAVAKNLGPSFGEFVPLSPLVAEMFARNDDNRATTNEIIRTIRLGAARQHFDTVIIYESEGTADSSSNPLSIGEWTLIGLFILPSQDVEARGVAQAMMIDVRNGYPYGTAQAQADDTSLSVRITSMEAEKDLAESVRLAAVNKLAPEVEKMMRKLRTELAEKRVARGGK